MGPSRHFRTRATWATYAILIGWSLFVLFPICWLLLMSLKTPEQQFSRPPLFLFRPTLQNYVDLFLPGLGQLAGLPGMQLPRYLLNSLIAGVASVGLAVLLATPAAYAFARMPFRLGGVLMQFLLLTRMMPPMAILVPLFLIGRRLEMLDSLFALTLVYTAINIPFTIFLLIGFFQQVPQQIEEAASIDGLSRWGILTRIAIPLTAPGIVAVLILGLWVTWTDLQFALILTSEGAKTMPIGIANLISEYTQLWGIVGSSGFIYTIPMLLFSIFSQKYIVKGLTLGAVAG
jgi:multiple sugar transport system permease protein